jgi:localization factor PodJL
MKPGIPWSVKGIDTEAREAAKHAARRSGMTLGEWLNTVIREQAEEPEPELQVPPARSAMHDIQSKLDRLSEQLTRMARRDQDTAAGRHYERSRPAPEQSLADILARVEASERQAAASYDQFDKRLETLGNKFAKGVESFPRNPEDVPGYRSLETAVRNIVDHIEASERKTRETLHTVQERLDDISYAASAPVDSDHLLANAPVIARIENRIADLSSRMTEKDAGIREDFRTLVQSEFGKLAARIDQAKHASEASAQRAQAQAVQQAQKDIRDLESRLEDFLTAAQAPQEFGRLRAEMEGLGQRVDDLKSEAASDHDLRSLRVVIEQLSARVAQGPDLRSLADLDRRLTEITKWLEQGRGDHVGNQIAELEQRVFDLDNRIAQAMRQDHAAQALAGVEREFAGLNDRLAATEQQLQHIATLEQSIHQLYQSMEQSRDWAREVAEDAANRMASRLTEDWSAKAPASGPSPELQALEKALETVRTNYETADQRNQETLRAVHETLEQIVNKLTELEQVRGPQVGARTEPAIADDPESSPAPENAQVWSELADEAGPDPYRPPDPPLSSKPEPVPVIKDDFIAAARRAQQAAAGQGPSAASRLLGREKPAHGTAPKAPSRFSLRFRRRERPPVQTPHPAAARAEDPGKRRRLILISILVLLAASAFAYNNYIKKPAEAPIMAPKAEETKPSGSSSVLEDVGKSVASSLDAVLSKSLAILGNGNSANPDPGGVKSNRGEIAINDAEALPAAIGTESLRQAALDGDPEAAFVVASRFAEGRNVPQDSGAAVRWFGVAAAKGLAPAQFRLGALLERGTGVAADPEAARQLYERAAGAGNVRAMHNAAVLLADGDKAKANYSRAARWFAEAAAHNLKDSQFNLALLYERGLGVSQDPGQALFWYSLAARQSDADAALKVKSLESTLPVAVTAKVRSELTQWAPQRDIPKANVVAISNPDWLDRPVAATASHEMPTIAAAQSVDSGDPAQEAQGLLRRLGFDVDNINGALGSRTRNSIRLFELQSGMPITGEVTPELLSRLRAKAG